MKLVHSVYFPLKEWRSILGSLIWLDLGENIVRSPLASTVDPLEDACWSSKKSFVCWMNSRTSALNSQAVSSSVCRRSSGTTSSINRSFSLINVRVSLMTAREIRKPARPVTGLADRIEFIRCLCLEMHSCDHFWSEPASGMFVLTGRFVHVARSQQLVDRSVCSHCSDLVARSQPIVHRLARSRSFADRTGRCYHS